VSADEPTPLKTVSAGSISGDGKISASSNGAVISHESEMQGLVNGHNGAASAANDSSDKALASL